MRRRLLAMRLRGSLLATSLFLGGMAVVAGPAPFACAGPGPDATLVVDTGGSEYKYCIALDAKSVSGLRLIELASQQHGLSYSLGYQGQAVCMLAGVGSNEEECFQGGEPFWGYWRGTASGGWSWSGSGGGSTSVSDGDVEGWSWGTGNDGGSHQAPSATTHASVCGPEETTGGGGKSEGNDSEKDGRSGKDDERGSKGKKDRGSGATDRSGGTSVAEPEAMTAGEEEKESGAQTGGDRKKRKDERKRRDRNEKTEEVAGAAAPLPSVSPTPDGSPSVAPAATSSEGPPAAGVVGLILTIALAFAGAWFLKRKHAATA